MSTQKLQDEEWPDFIVVAEETHAVYGRISDAVGDLTAAMLEAKMLGVLTPTVANSLYDFLENVQASLDEHLEES